ncbi:hypothetical protein GQ55_4G277000 [Panicum hallii var. hallii]|uniref:DUF1618 domain-containing protein n=1 Tax=Panicum hallii var. hallii TaxID=1504633 RepID=A0A2T7E0V2_9POAL|nr:hypothetical protein GQ55_4G277000 [Panicum hallii var. hallii]
MLQDDSIHCSMFGPTPALIRQIVWPSRIMLSDTRFRPEFAVRTDQWPIDATERATSHGAEESAPGALAVLSPWSFGRAVRCALGLSTYTIPRSTRPLSPPPTPPRRARSSLPWELLEREAPSPRAATPPPRSPIPCDGKLIQATFFVRRPPRVSYVCVHSPDAAEISVEPVVLATEGDLVLLRVSVGREGDYFENFDYYVYRAGGSRRGHRSRTSRGPLMSSTAAMPASCATATATRASIFHGELDDDNERS